MKTKIKSINFPFSESNFIDTEKEFTSFADADEHLSEANWREPVTRGGYFKTDFVLTYTDGETYKGRYDIRCDEDSLTEHIKAHAANVATAPWMKPEDKEAFKNFMAKYQIED